MGYYKGLAAGMALGALGTLGVVVMLDPKARLRMMREGKGMLKDCKKRLQLIRHCGCWG